MDALQTFNYLLGLRIERKNAYNEGVVIHPLERRGKAVGVLWREYGI